MGQRVSGSVCVFVCVSCVRLYRHTYTEGADPACVYLRAYKTCICRIVSKADVLWHAVWTTWETNAHSIKYFDNLNSCCIFCAKAG